MISITKVTAIIAILKTTITLEHWRTKNPITIIEQQQQKTSNHTQDWNYNYFLFNIIYNYLQYKT